MHLRIKIVSIYISKNVSESTLHSFFYPATIRYLDALDLVTNYVEHINLDVDIEFDLIRLVSGRREKSFEMIVCLCVGAIGNLQSVAKRCKIVFVHLNMSSFQKAVEKPNDHEQN